MLYLYVTLLYRVAWVSKVSMWFGFVIIKIIPKYKIVKLNGDEDWNIWSPVCFYNTCSISLHLGITMYYDFVMLEGSWYTLLWIWFNCAFIFVVNLGKNYIRNFQVFEQQLSPLMAGSKGWCFSSFPFYLYCRVHLVTLGISF